MMLIKHNYKESYSNDFFISYDPDFDILRVFNNPDTEYYFETLKDNVEIALDEYTNEVVGIQVTDFKKNIGTDMQLKTYNLFNFDKALSLVKENI